MYICERCGKEHDGTFGSGRFCCMTCAHKKPFLEDSRKKLSKSLKGTHPKRINKKCDKCNEEIAPCNFKKHYNTCDGLGPKKFKKLEVCPFCNKDIKNINGGTHMKWCNLNPNRSKNKNCDCKRNFGGWNKGKRKSNIRRNRN